MSDIALEFRAVTRTFPASPPVHAVRDVSIAIPRGSFSAIIGPSGSGKSTFLNLAAGLDRPTSGEVLIGGKKIAELTKTEMNRFRSRHTGFVFQSYNLFPTLTAVENVEFTAIIRGDDAREARRQALQALEAVGLLDKAPFLPSQLSGGQQQRVAVARALATKPDIVFADEPTANLDSVTATELVSMFEELNRTRGITFLFSTHDRMLIGRVKNRIEMKDGRILPGA